MIIKFTDLRLRDVRPTGMGIILTGFVLLWCVEKATVWPMLAWVTVLTVSTVMSIALHNHSARAGRQMALDFPLDPEIQAKYGKYLLPEDREGQRFAR